MLRSGLLLLGYSGRGRPFPLFAPGHPGLVFASRPVRLVSAALFPRSARLPRDRLIIAYIAGAIANCWLRNRIAHQFRSARPYGSRRNAALFIFRFPASIYPGAAITTIKFSPATLWLPVISTPVTAQPQVSAAICNAGIALRLNLYCQFIIFIC